MTTVTNMMVNIQWIVGIISIERSAVNGPPQEGALKLGALT